MSTLSVIPLSPVPNQTLQVVLNGQQCTIGLWTKRTGMYLDLYVNNVLLLGGVPALNMTKIVRDGYLGFIGDLYFYDTQGNSDPTYDGLGTRYTLFYGAP